MTQSEIVRRIDEICHEFDSRLVSGVSTPVARLELAKALAETESALGDVLIKHNASLEALEQLRAKNAVLTDKLARMTNEVLKVRAHLSTGGKYAIEREDKTTMGVGEELMWSDIFEKIDALLPPYED